MTKLIPAAIAAFLTFAAPAFGQSDFYAQPAPAGVDTGDCTNSAFPCATIKYAVRQALLAPTCGASQTIHLLGTSAFHETLNLSGGSPCNFGSVDRIGYRRLVISGVSSTSTAWYGGTGVYDQGVIMCGPGCEISVENISFVCNQTTGQSCLFAQMGGVINVFGGNAFNTASVDHLHAENSGSQIMVWGSYTIQGNAGNMHALAATGATIEYNPVSAGIVILNACACSFTYAMFNAQMAAQIFVATGTAFWGTWLAGNKYSVTAGGVFQTFGRISAIPGTIFYNDGTGVAQ